MSVWHVKEVCACGAMVEQDCHSYGGPEQVRREWKIAHYRVCPLNLAANAREAAARQSRRNESHE